MSKDFITSNYLEFLKTIGDTSSKLTDFIKEKKYNSLQVSSVVSHLSRRGYLEEKGLYKRKLVLTSSGKDIIKKYQ